MSGYIHHISITCSNINNTLAFYANLGFHKTKVYRDDECIIQHLSDRNGFIIEVFYYINSHHLNKERPFSTERLGITHFAFIVCNINESLHALKKQSIECGNIMTARVDSYRYFFTYDPDGNAIEIIEAIK
ncbi:MULTISPECIES: VOC family protein [Yersinia]|uniref:VOC family protein n=1 Tax=Yersinia TaxID=629 RepID=UPI001C8DD502|nr:MULTISPECIES: VOC family protein [Yersinia]MBX9485994.1 VOC family protein [Yersinia enterocolitica]MBX9492165.1 VOC family protein [Yersinia enterocolitica]HEN3611027.1 VOC family protein [Yersinia enterocolitica]HEN3640949.1 VOC family protein [Yersinia enterocolitica]HEN3647951.1 VOC family protein [Yersinia enterocolitica]